MSRTYRKYPRFVYVALGKFWTNDEWPELKKALIELHGNPIGWNGYYNAHCFYDCYFKKGRDHKTWNKPPKWYKQMNRRCERAKEKSALRNDKEIPLFKKSDAWNWS